MLERLFDLLLHAKAGTIAAVFLLGTTGALVTATVQNGVTTITITEASPSPSASASATASPTASPSASTAVSTPSASPSSSPSSSASANACADTAHAAADAVKTVNTAFNGFHTDLEHMRKDVRTDAARNTLETGDKTLQQIRNSAVKAIHATNTCAKNDDNDKDENNQDEDKDEHSDKHDQPNFVLAVFQRLFGGNVTVVTTTTASPSPTVAPTATASASASTGVTFTGTDPKAIADQAVAAMKLVFDTTVAGLPTSSASPKHDDKPAFTARPARTRGPDPSQKREGEHD